jgi:hypothetical protein
MRIDTIETVAPGAIVKRRGLYLAVAALGLASCAAAVHYGVRLADWRGSVAAAHRGVHRADREEQLRSVIVLTNHVHEAVTALRAAEKSSDPDVQRRATDALRHIAELAK